MLELVRDTYRYRELIWALASKELKIRYKRSALGFLWALLNPALLMAILTLVFSTISRVMGVRYYSVFLMSMLLPWTFFSQTLSYAVESIVSNGNLIKKVDLPKLVFPVAAMVSNIVNFVLSLIPLVLLIVALRFPLHWTWIYLPIPLLGLTMFALGLGFLVAALNVFYRDVAHIIQILLSAWFYFTPILFSLDFVSPHLRWILRLNPILYVMNGFRLAIYYGLLPTAASVGMSLACGAVALLIGFGVFRRCQNSFVFYV
jgi:ABC-type polysaccharide/polyol phosphate export permease